MGRFVRGHRLNVSKRVRFNQILRLVPYEGEVDEWETPMVLESHATKLTNSLNSIRKEPGAEDSSLYI